MKKLSIAVAVYLIIIIVSSILVINYKNQELGNELFPTSISKKMEMTKESQVKKINIYCSMANVENYPIILSEYISSVKIINQTENIVFAEEKIENTWITLKVLVKHSFFPYDRHVIKIIDGDAKGSLIDITFEEIESGTRLKAKMDMKFKGLFLPFGLIPDGNFKHGINTLFGPFENDAMSKDYSC